MHSFTWFDHKGTIKQQRKAVWGRQKTGGFATGEKDFWGRDV
jgi:hypothetical protein